MAAAALKKLYRVEQDGSTYYATGEDAYAAYARLVAHDQKEGNFSHKADVSFSVEVEEVGEVAEDVLAWQVG